MSEINKVCRLFSTECSVADIERLENIAHDLWISSKQEVIKRMKSPRPNESVYTNSEINMMNRITFKYNAERNCLAMAFFQNGNICFKIPFCPMRAHHNPVSSTIGWVGYEHNMIRLGLFISCFKNSCTNKHFMPDGHLIFSFPFISSCIENEIKKYIYYIKHNPVKLFFVEEGDGNELIDRYINTNNITVGSYIQNAQSIHQLYAFCNDLYGNFLLCVTNFNIYIAIIVPHKKGNGKVIPEMFIHDEKANIIIKYLHANQKLSGTLYRELISLLEKDYL